MNIMQANPNAPARLARAAAAAAMALGLALAPLAAPAAALAEDGTVTIVHPGTAMTPTYSAYRVFDADMGAGNVATHVAWPDDDTKAAVLGYLDGNGYAAWLTASGRTAAGDHDNAQNALEFTGSAIDSSARASWTSTNPKTAAGDSFAAGLARAVAAAGLDGERVDAGTAFTAPEGYYLIVSRSLAARATGTAPIWLALGGGTTTVTPKAGAVSVSKTVKAPGDGGYALATDTPPGVDLDYRITATLPSNLGAYEEFFLEIDDWMTNVELADGDLSSVVVKVGGADVTSALASGAIGSIEQVSGGFKVAFDDLLTAPSGVTKDSVITVDYKAHVTPRAEGDGGTNYAAIKYSKDPNTDETQTDADPSGGGKAFSYRLRMTKVDKSNGAVLPGAKYTVKVTQCPDDPTAVGKYVQADGTLAATAHEFVTGSDGTVVVGGLDAGTYTVHETSAPAHYEEQDDDAVVTLTPTIDSAMGRLTALAAEVIGGEAADVAGDEHTRVTATDAATRTVDVLMADDRAITVPATGLEGPGALYAAAGVLGACGAGGLALLGGRRGESRKPARGAHRG